MNSFIGLFTTKEIIIMAGTIVGILFIVLILTVWDILVKRKNNNLEFEKFDEELEKEELDEMIVPIKKLKEEEKIESVVSVKEETIEETKYDSEPLIIEIEEEFETIPTPQEKAKMELNQVVSELSNPKPLEDTLSSIEMMEEENAIISYQELLETTKEMNIVLSDSGDEPISINEIYKMTNDSSIENNKTENLYNNFINSENVTTGVEFEKENLAEIQLENTANLEKLDKEIRKTNEFLNILNELKKNLE